MYEYNDLRVRYQRYVDKITNCRLALRTRWCVGLSLDPEGKKKRLVRKKNLFSQWEIILLDQKYENSPTYCNFENSGSATPTSSHSNIYESL